MKPAVKVAGHLRISWIYAAGSAVEFELKCWIGDLKFFLLWFPALYSTLAHCCIHSSRMMSTWHGYGKLSVASVMTALQANFAVTLFLSVVAVLWPWETVCRDGAVLFLTYFRLAILVKLALCWAAMEIASVSNPDPMVVIIFTVQHCCVCVVPRLFSPWSYSALWRRRSRVKERRENNVSGFNFGEVWNLWCVFGGSRVNGMVDACWQSVSRVWGVRTGEACVNVRSSLYTCWCFCFFRLGIGEQRSSLHLDEYFLELPNATPLFQSLLQWVVVFR